MVNVYQCIVCNAEMISDAFDFKEIPETGCFEAETIMVIEDEDAEDTKKIPNIAKAFRMNKFEYTKKNFVTYFKSYLKKISAHVAETNKDDVPNFKKAAMGFIKFVLKIPKKDMLEFWMNEENDATGLVAVSSWPETDASPKFWIFKYGLKMTKC